ncbi:MAG: hypothetical protein M1823_003230 [Watsoniomyces obsoletus]|nr:MAG: hypothetical protein M1823_003230 [Watsoniomyces obsoletus]
MASQYQMLEELGSGSFGVVYKAIERSTGEIVAIKQIDLESSEDDIEEIQQEISVLSTCASPFVTRYKTSFLRGHKLWIVMEFLGGGSCLDLLQPGPFSEYHVAIICRELLLGLDYLHREGKIHRDVKAANVLLSSSGRVKLADFGVAAQLSNLKSQRNTMVGTPFWMAPEVIQQIGHDCKADLWSLGITAMEMVNGEPPHASTHPMKALFQIPQAPAPRLNGNQYSRELKDFVACCLVKDPDRRPTAKELLGHKFISGAGRIEALRELVDRRRQWAGGKDDGAHLKYYEETMKPMSQTTDADDWVFDTVKAPTMIVQQQTMKRRKCSAPPPPSNPIIYAEEALEQLDLNATVPADPSSAPPHPPASQPTTVRKVTQPKRPPTADRPSPARRASAQRQPLGPDLSFGNGASTVRQFRRVSDNSPTTTPDGSIVHRDGNGNENASPKKEVITKEARLGRRAYTSAIDAAFQETHAQTSSQVKREALARVATAWEALDKIDPDGEYQLLRAMVSKLQGDPRLASLLQPPPTAKTSESPKPKLVLAQANPHLKSHRRRQSVQVDGRDGRDGGGVVDHPAMPGQIVPGKEHIHQLSSVLYGRWVDGLKSRWALQ